MHRVHIVHVLVRLQCIARPRSSYVASTDYLCRPVDPLCAYNLQTMCIGLQSSKSCPELPGGSKGNRQRNRIGCWSSRSMAGFRCTKKMISIVFLVTNSLLEPTRNKMEVSCVSLCVMPIRASPQMQWILVQICYTQILQQICHIHLKAADFHMSLYYLLIFLIKKNVFSIATLLHCTQATLCFLSCRRKLIEQFN